jgi:hypothetical protein
MPSTAKPFENVVSIAHRSELSSRFGRVLSRCITNCACQVHNERQHRFELHYCGFSRKLMCDLSGFKRNQHVIVVISHKRKSIFLMSSNEAKLLSASKAGNDATVRALLTEGDVDVQACDKVQYCLLDSCGLPPMAGHHILVVSLFRSCVSAWPHAPLLCVLAGPCASRRAPAPVPR